MLLRRDIVHWIDGEKWIETRFEDSDNPSQSPSECEHFGKEIDQRMAELCGLRSVAYTVFSCAIHGECVLHRTCRKQVEQLCYSCQDFSKKTRESVA